MREYTKSLASWAAKLTYEELPAEVIEKLKMHMLDMLGCAIAGSDKPEIAQMKAAMENCGETGSARAWGSQKQLPFANAMLVNGAMSHTVELDDLHKPSKIHAACVIVPPVLTAAQALGADGKTVMLALAVGYEIVLRMGMALGTDSHRRRGWHATATCGAFGAAAACGVLLGLGEVQMANALGLAGTSTGGLMAYTADGSMSKRLHAGKAAENGWMAASLAKAGFTGPTYVLEASDGGYAHAASDKYDLDILLDGLGEKYHILDTGLKFYACCGHIHQAIDAALQLMRENKLAAEDVASAKVSTYDVSGMAWGFQRAPQNTVEAQFNIPYAVAVAMCDGQAFLPQFARERLGDKKVLDLAARISVETADRYTVRYPAEWCSGVEITLKDGRQLFREVCGAKGDPQNPLSEEEVESKFRVLTDGYISAEHQDALIACVKKTEQLENAARLAELLKF
ncbi:MAG: MmgE/PrpD family protein [Christensenellaceae bacterium]|nr:MmgE/PrpD family protein [Christensenellaceae bacterium]